MGITYVPCIIADDLTPDQIKAFRIADNKVGELAEWDFDKLDKELEELTGFDMSAFGFESFNFEVGTEEEQGDLTEKKINTIICPRCGESIEV